MANNYIYACERSKLFYSRIGAALHYDYCEIIQAPVDTKLMDPKKYDAKYFSEYKGIKILTVGNIVPSKGHEMLINMARWVSNNSSKIINFFIVGSEWDNQTSYIKSVKQKLKQYGLNNVHFLGGQSDIANFLKSADLYICSSNYEASPISVWEAMSMGKAIISTDVGDIKTIFDEHNCGLVIEPGNYVSMGKAVLQLIRQKDKRSLYEKNARKAAAKFLDIEICTNKHANIYSQIIKN